MRRDEISAATHGDMPFHNPLDPAQLDDVIGRIPLSRGDRVLDLGCGPGELLLRLHARHGIRGVGIDNSAVQIAEAERRRPAGADLEFIQGDADDYAGRDFALTACLGSIHALGGGLAQLAAMTRAGGWVLLADGFWRREPDPSAPRATTCPTGRRCCWPARARAGPGGRDTLGFALILMRKAA